MPLLCTWWAVGIVSFMTEAHLSKTDSRGGAGGTAVCQFPHFCSEGVLGAGVWSYSSMEVEPCHSHLCPDSAASLSHREGIWLIIPMTIEWGLCLPEGAEPTPQKP